MGNFKASYGIQTVLTVCITAALNLHATANVFNRESEPLINSINVAHNPEFDPSMIPSKIINASNIWQAENDLLGPPLNPEEFIQGESLSDQPLIFSDEDDPILLANLLEGDIQIADSQDYFNLVAHTVLNTVHPRNAIKDMTKRWNNGVMPYTIANSYSQEDRQKMARAFQEIHSRTCIRLVPRTNEKDYVHITKGNGCSSSVGRTGGRQSVSLGTGCVHHGVIIHELMHAMGFWHEQSRADRETKVSIQWNNIRGGLEYNFNKYDWDIIQSLGLPYDTGSIMHYGKYAFTKFSGQPTIISKDNSEIGQRNHLSQLDASKINKLYSICGGGVKPTPPEPVKPTVTKPTPGPTEICDDSSEHCSYWAAKGECNKNPDYMVGGCPKACGICVDNEICRDRATNCGKWKNDGFCTTHHGYMHKTCPNSCGICKKTAPAANCTDGNVFCEEWALAGECDRNPKYMLFSCRKSCKMC